MQRKLAFIIMAISVLPVLFSFSNGPLKESLFDGVWQLTGGSYNGGEIIKPETVQVKVFQDGKFDGYVMSPEISAKTMSGIFKLLNDTTYTETLTAALNKAMVGQTYEINYKIEDKVMTASGSYDAVNNGTTIKVNYRQTWKKVDFPQRK